MYIFSLNFSNRLNTFLVLANYFFSLLFCCLPFLFFFLCTIIREHFSGFVASSSISIWWLFASHKSNTMFRVHAMDRIHSVVNVYATVGIFWFGWMCSNTHVQWLRCLFASHAAAIRVACVSHVLVTLYEIHSVFFAGKCACVFACVNTRVDRDTRNFQTYWSQEFQRATLKLWRITHHEQCDRNWNEYGYRKFMVSQLVFELYRVCFRSTLVRPLSSEYASRVEREGQSLTFIIVTSPRIRWAFRQCKFCVKRQLWAMSPLTILLAV